MFIAMGAAQTAYRKLRMQSRKKAIDSETRQGPNSYPAWMGAIAEYLPEEEANDEHLKIVYTKRERREIRAQMATNCYDRLAWRMYDRITGTTWFETVILMAILVVGATTGLELEAGDNPSEKVEALLIVVSKLSNVVFTAEIILKVIAEGTRPLEFFTDSDNGAFNTFDFLIVASGWFFDLFTGKYCNTVLQR